MEQGIVDIGHVAADLHVGPHVVHDPGQGVDPGEREGMSYVCRRIWGYAAHVGAEPPQRRDILIADTKPHGETLAARGADANREW